MKICDEFRGTITLTENSSRELFKVLKEQDEAFINDVLCGRCGFTLKSADGRAVELVPAPKWIPCSERLPDQCGQYLVTLETISLSYKGHEQIRLLDIWCFDEDGWLPRDLEKVLAWMPLPDPYEQEENPRILTLMPGPDPSCEECKHSMKVWTETKPCIFEGITMCRFDDEPCRYEPKEEE